MRGYIYIFFDSQCNFFKIIKTIQSSKKLITSIFGSSTYTTVMATSIRLRRLGAIAAVAGGAYTIVRQPSFSSNDRGDKLSALETFRRKISDPFAVVPPRNTQEAALIGSSLANPLDILVVGGGATGCGVALDAATRGLRVGLVEREDFASGTSSRSTKLIHGG